MLTMDEFKENMLTLMVLVGHNPQKFPVLSAVWNPRSSQFSLFLKEYLFIDMFNLLESTRLCVKFWRF